MTIHPTAALTTPTRRTVAASGTRCIGPCTFRARAPRHHDRLLSVTDGVLDAVELLDLAVTWDELDYSGEELIGPSGWPEFLAGHRWPDRALAVRLFGLASDIAARSRALSEQWTAPAFT